jgi:hypothetical protein
MIEVFSGIKGFQPVIPQGVELLEKKWMRVCGFTQGALIKGLCGCTEGRTQT